MKKIFTFALLGTLALVGCSKVNPTNDENSEAAQKAIDFQVASYVPQTKSDSHASIKGETTSFTTYAWYNPLEGEMNQSFMSGETISYSNNVWAATSRTYYWPKTGSINFVSYFSKNTHEPSEITTTSLKWSGVTIASDDNIMFADEAWNYSSNGSGVYKYDGVTDGVPTLFHHALSQVEIKVALSKTTDGKDTKPTTWGASVAAGALAAVNNKGSLTLTNSDPTSTSTKAWTVSGLGENPTDLQKAIGWAEATGTGVTENIETSSVLSLGTDASTILSSRTVMPQALGSDNVVSFKVTLTTTCDGKSITEVIPINVALTEMSAANTAWKMNYKYSYTITIDPSTNEIHFDPAVEPWKTAE